MHQKMIVFLSNKEQIASTIAKSNIRTVLVPFNKKIIGQLTWLENPAMVAEES